MTLRRIIGLSCLILTALFLAIGVAEVGQGIGSAAALITFLVWLSAYKWPSPWLPSAALAVSIGLAAVGLVIGGSPTLMLLAATLDLAIWDLVQLDQALAGNLPTQAVSLLEKKHYQNLSLTFGLAVLVTFLGRMIHFQIPFVGMILLATLAFFSLGRVWHMNSD